MAARASTYWRTMLKRMEGNRMFATSTIPKMKPALAATADHSHQLHPNYKTKGFAGAALKGDYAPIYVTMGMVVLAMAFGVHTAKQQLRYSPSVHISKKKRETIPEVDDPDHTMEEADKFINKSFLRKVGHIQGRSHSTIPDPIRGDIFTRPRQVESLKSVGVGPSSSHL
ncbi:hypothetical protein BVC80_9101g254 [Macleaya cordata]|uniref:NFU1 iron-sulfur cluster protein n=1 Tax=Macleaya cordata TaxID=56857 RepID=A0A200QGZ4_MACCD|nr:hypothetical protein BVC80_9101g254 [Macleaya cordata]